MFSFAVATLLRNCCICKSSVFNPRIFLVADGLSDGRFICFPLDNFSCISCIFFKFMPISERVLRLMLCWVIRTDMVVYLIKILTYRKFKVFGGSQLLLEIG